MLCQSYGYKERHYFGDRAYPMNEILLDRLYLADPRPEGMCKAPVRYNADDEREGADIEEWIHCGSFWMNKTATAEAIMRNELPENIGVFLHASTIKIFVPFLFISIFLSRSVALIAFRGISSSF